jgi:thiol-disulfide isomerase/thioredoxin
LSKVINVESFSELENKLANNENVVVVFSARDWCVPCQRLAPHVEKAAAELDDFLFLDVDVDHVEGVKEEFGIQSVPQIWYYEDSANGGLPGIPVKGRTAIQLINELR